MSLPSFGKIPIGEFQNFDNSIKFFEDIITWGERLKEILNLKRVETSPGPVEYYLLVHLLGNAFTNSILLAMRGYIFHSFAIARLGIDSFVQISIIETNYEQHLKVWKNFHQSNRKKPEWQEFRKKYDEIFREKRKNHDYSKFLSKTEIEEIIKRWDMLSRIGSHINFTQTIYSFQLTETDGNIEVKSGLFDTNFEDETTIGKHLLWIIDTYFIVSKPLANILEAHEVHLYKSSDIINKMFNEWVEFKLKKAKDFNIDLSIYV